MLEINTGNDFNPLAQPAPLDPVGILVTNNKDSGMGSFRYAIEQANIAANNIGFVQFTKNVGLIQLTSGVEYTGTRALRIDGRGSTIAGGIVDDDDLLGIFNVSKGADLDIKNINFRNSFANGIYVEAPSTASGSIDVKLSNVKLQNNDLNGLLINDRENPDDDDNPNGSNASVKLTVISSVISGNGTGGLDQDGIRINEGGNGSIFAEIINSQFNANGADGLELDERGNGNVTLEVRNANFDRNGFFDPEDLDDGIDIDEAESGDIIVKINNATIKNNFDEGLDLDEAGNGSINLEINRLVAQGNVDENIKLDEENSGGVTAKIDNAVISGSQNDDGMEIDEEDDGNLNLEIRNSIIANNAEEGIQVGQSGDVANINRTSVSLTNVRIERNKGFGVIVDDREDADDPANPNGASGGIVLNVNNSVVFNNGTTESDQDGIRVNEGGSGNILTTIANSRVERNGADGLELDERGAGSVTLNTANSSFNQNGFFDPADLDDGIDIDEDEAGGITANLISTNINYNFDEGLDLDEAADGSLTVNINGLEAKGNFDENVKLDEAGLGSINVGIVNAVIGGSKNNDGMEITEEDDGSVILRMANSVIANNAEDGIQVGQLGDTANINNTRVELSNVRVEGNLAFGVLVDDREDADDPANPNGASGGITLNIVNSSVSRNGFTESDQDGIRVNEGGDGSINAQIGTAKVDGNGADGLELDERGAGDVNLSVTNSSFNANGFFDFNDLDDGIDIDEEEAGNINVNIGTTKINNNFDEGLDLDEAGDGSVFFIIGQIEALNNADANISIDEAGTGGIGGDILFSKIGGSPFDNGVFIGSEDQGGVDVGIIGSTITRNAGFGLVVEANQGLLFLDDVLFAQNFAGDFLVSPGVIVTKN